MAEDIIRFDSVSKRFGDIEAVSDVSFSIGDGELLALVGPSGSGKTTTLRMLAGFENPTEGSIYLEGRDITDVPVHRRDTAMVFQNYALFPHMTVGDNIRFGLKQHGWKKADREARVDEVLEMVDLEGMKNRKPSSLSGGQQQRVATARALAIEPKVLLMDEPLGALDKRLRDQLQVELLDLQHELGITTVYVTHNQEEALTMADRVAVMNQGRIEQVSTPTDIYKRPSTDFVAEFIGDTNHLDGELRRDNGHLEMKVGDERLHLGVGSINDDASVFVRPESLTVFDPDAAGRYDNEIRGRVDQVLFLGSKIRYVVDAGMQSFVVDHESSDRAPQFRRDDEVLIGWPSESTLITAA